MNILVIRASAIGDVFLASAFAKYVKSAYPNCHLSWLVEKRCSGVLTNIREIDELIFWERDKKAGIKGIFSSASKVVFPREYDLVIDLQCLLKLFPVLRKVKAKKIVGISEYEFGMNIFYKTIIPTKRFEPLKDKYYRIAQTVLGYKGEPLDPIVAYTEEDKAKTEEFFVKNNISNCVAMVFATSMEHKYWNKDKWVALAKELEKEGKTGLLFGGKGDLDYANYILERTNNVFSCVGETSITQTMAILEKCIACVSTDTAIMHFSSIIGIPTISLYGTNFFYSHHLGRENVEILFKGDWNNKDQKVPDDICKKNMDSITVEDVVNSIHKYIN